MSTVYPYKDNVMKKINIPIKKIQLFNIILSLIGIAYLINDFKFHYFITCVLTFLLFGIVGVNAGYHRYFSHRSYETNRFFSILMALIGTLTTLGSIISWAAIHRYHHLHADKIEDPHSPKHIGVWNAYTYNWSRANISRKFINDLIKDPTIVFLHKHYYKVILAYVLILGIIDPWLIIFAYALPATGCLNGVSAVTVISHVHGYRNYNINDDAKNSWIASVLSLGEGWHNNHHKSPYKWMQGEKWWEIDPPGYFIKLIRKKC